MAREPVALQGVAETMLITLRMRAYDAASAHPILGDPYAAEVLDRLDTDRAVPPGARGNAPAFAARGATLDRWTRHFLDTHPDGQVLHLGCGLDSRPLRLDRPVSSRWVDVDQPEVIDLRRRVYDLPPEIVTIAASVTDATWWSQVDPHRPTLIVAEGLLMYLPGDEVHALLDRARDHLGRVEVAFDGVAPWMVALTHLAGSLQRSGIRFHWALEDLAGRHPGAVVLESASVLGLLAAAPLPALWRAVSGVLALVPPLRDALRLQHVVLPDPAQAPPGTGS